MFYVKHFFTQVSKIIVQSHSWIFFLENNIVCSIFYYRKFVFIVAHHRSIKYMTAKPGVQSKENIFFR